MNDDPAEIRPAVEKLIPNPQQVFDALALQRNARPHARMTEEMLSGHDRRLQRRQELKWLSRQGSLERLGRLLVVGANHELADGHAVGVQGLETAQSPPMLGDSGIVEKDLEQRFVISFQRDEIRWERIAHEP